MKRLLNFIPFLFLWFGSISFATDFSPEPTGIGSEFMILPSAIEECRFQMVNTFAVEVVKPAVEKNKTQLLLSFPTGSTIQYFDNYDYKQARDFVVLEKNIVGFTEDVKELSRGENNNRYEWVGHYHISLTPAIETYTGNGYEVKYNKIKTTFAADFELSISDVKYVYMDPRIQTSTFPNEIVFNDSLWVVKTQRGKNENVFTCKLKMIDNSYKIISQ